VSPGRLGQNTHLERVRYIDAGEYQRLMRAAKGDELAYYAFYTCANLGLRVGELVTITPADLDPARGEFVVRTLKQKRAVLDTVPCAPQVLKEILAYAKRRRRKNGERIFPYTPRRIQQLWQKYSKKARIYVAGSHGRRGRGIHCLRHFKAMDAKSKGLAREQVRVLLRHRSADSTEVYWHAEGMRKAVDIIGDVGSHNGTSVPSRASSSRTGARPSKKRSAKRGAR
jgi:integrase